MKAQPLILFLLIFATFLQAQNVFDRNLIHSIEQLNKTKHNTYRTFVDCEIYKSFPDTPLFIVDGVPVNYSYLKKLNPHNIESIDILRESSSGIISCRIPGKVILITTRQVNLRTIRIKDKEMKTGIKGVTVTFIKHGNKPVIHQTDSAGLLTYNLKQLQFDSVIISSASYLTSRLSIEDLKSKAFNVELRRNYIQLKEITIDGLHVIVCRNSLYCKIDHMFMCKGRGIKIDSNATDQKQVLLSSSSIKTYPNPVKNNGTLQLNFGTAKPGLYQIRLLNAAGQLYYSFQKQINSPNEIEQIHLNERMSAGIYLLQITDEKKRLVQTSKVMVQ